MMRNHRVLIINYYNQWTNIELILHVTDKSTVLTLIQFYNFRFYDYPVLGDDENLKKVAEGFSKEFLICKEQIETQLNILL